MVAKNLTLSVSVWRTCLSLRPGSIHFRLVRVDDCRSTLWEGMMGDSTWLFFMAMAGLKLWTVFPSFPSRCCCLYSVSLICFSGPAYEDGERESRGGWPCLLWWMQRQLKPKPGSWPTSKTLSVRIPVCSAPHQNNTKQSKRERKS